MKNLLYLLLIPMLLSACKANKQPLVETTTAAPATTSAADNVYRFIVSFYSIGTGTDGNAIQRLNEFLEKYEDAKHVQLQYTPIRWGREGEVDYCFKLTNLDAKEQVKFIQQIKDLLKGAEHVNYKENEARP